jgi:hypothetical protein
LPGTRDDLEKFGITLSEGLELVLWSDDADHDHNRDDLLCVGIVRHGSGRNLWVAEVDWPSIENESRIRRRLGLATNP